MEALKDREVRLDNAAKGFSAETPHEVVHAAVKKAIEEALSKPLAK